MNPNKKEKVSHKLGDVVWRELGFHSIRNTREATGVRSSPRTCCSMPPRTRGPAPPRRRPRAKDPGSRSQDRRHRVPGSASHNVDGKRRRPLRQRGMEELPGPQEVSLGRLKDTLDDLAADPRGQDVELEQPQAGHRGLRPTRG